MVRFYDAKDMEELGRIQTILQQHGIEFFLNERSSALPEVLVAEEDVPFAEDLIRQHLH